MRTSGPDLEALPSKAPQPKKPAWIPRLIWEQVTRGVTPKEIALTVALGITLGCFPLLGSTTWLCLAAGMWLKLNHPAIQAANYVAYPLQIALVVPFLRVGERLFLDQGVPLEPARIAQIFLADPGQALGLAGTGLLGAIAAWSLIAAPAAWLIYQAVLWFLRHLARSTNALPSHDI